MKKSKKQEESVLKSSKGDKVHAVVRSGLGAIPFAGQTAIELFSAVVTPPLEKRRDEWMLNVGEMLGKLSEERKVNIKELQENDAFIDILMDASQAAIRNSNVEKREALRNAVLNAALNQTLEEALQHMFIRWVDEFTFWHLRILKLFRNPKAWAEQNGHKFPSYAAGGGLDKMLESAYPELKNKSEFYNQIWKDMHQRGLLTTNSLQGLMTKSGLFSNRASDLGKQFLNFIEIGV